MSKLNCMHIKNFRGINDLKLENLKNINIFIGENNAGKTSILEAVQIISNPFSQFHLVKVARQRELRTQGNYLLSLGEAIKWLFEKNDEESDMFILEYNYNGQNEVIKIEYSEEEYVVISSDHKEVDDLNNSIEIEVKTKIEKLIHGQQIHSVEHAFGSQKIVEAIKSYKNYILFDCNYISSVEHKLNQLQVNNLSNTIVEGKKEEILEALKFFDDQIVGIELAEIQEKTGIYVVHERLGIVPLTVFGDGLRKALVIALKIISSADGIVLIDEIETGIHTTLIPKFIKWVTTMAAKYNVQIFATTHSLETVDGILAANIDELEELSFYRLSNKNNKIKIKHFDGQNMKNLRYDFGQDVR